MGVIKSYRDLEVWSKGIELVQEIYHLTKRFPSDEVFGLVAQMKRASVSIPSNIAEGFMRQYTPEFVQFLSIALGSCGELDTQAEISKRLGFLNQEVHKQVAEKINLLSRMIRSLIKRLKGPK